jgi:hypothetical protein
MGKLQNSSRRWCNLAQNGGGRRPKHDKIGQANDIIPLILCPRYHNFRRRYGLRRWHACLLQQLGLVLPHVRWSQYKIR